MAKRAAIYTRVSTDEQAENGYSLIAQAENCKKYAEQHGFDITASFKDDYSGTKLERPEFSRLRALVSRREIDVIVVYSPDRLTRNLAHMLIIREELQRANVDLHYCNRGKSEDTPEGRMTENIEGVFAEYWREKILQTSSQGRRAKANSGRVIGSGGAPYGYRLEGRKKDVHLVVIEDDARIIRQIFAWYLAGIGAQAIADKLVVMGVPRPGDKSRAPKKRVSGLWSSRHVYPILHNETYAGTWHAYTHKMIRGKVIHTPPEMWIAVNVPAIIDRAIWQAAQDKLARGREMSPRGAKHEYLMGRRLTCTCGYHMQGRSTRSKNEKRYFFYWCNGRVRQISDGTCKMPLFPVAKVDATVWRWVEGLFEVPEQLLDGLEAVQAHRDEEAQPLRELLAIIESKEAENDAKISRLLDLYLSRDINKEMLDDKKVQLERIRADLAVQKRETMGKLAHVTITDERIRSIHQFAAQVHRKLGDTSFAAKRYLIELLDVTAEAVLVEGKKYLNVRCMIDESRLPVESSPLKTL